MISVCFQGKPFSITVIPSLCPTRNAEEADVEQFYEALPEKAMAPHPVLLPEKSRGWRSLVGYSPWGRWESDTTERLHFPSHFHALEKEMAPHSSVLAWRIPGTGEPGGLLFMGSHRVRHD